MSTPSPSPSPAELEISPPRTRAGRIASAFQPPGLPAVSRRAFRFHMSYALLDGVAAGIMGNAPVMAVKAMHATDAQLQLPLALTSIGLFISVFTGAAMSTRRKVPFVLLPGLLGALSILAMAWTRSAVWFLLASEFFDL